MRQIVINGFRNANDAQLIISFHRFFVDFMRGILRIIAANVKKVADIVRLKDFEKPLHIFARFLGIFFEIQFVAAGAQRSGRSVAQPGDGLGFLFVYIYKVFVKDAQNAIGSSVDLFDAFMPAGLLNDARQARVNYRRRTA